MLPFDPKKPLFGFKMRFPHAERRIEFFVDEVEELFYFRPKHAPQDWMAVPGDTSTGFLGRKALPPYNLLCEAKPLIEEGLFFRQFFLPDPHEGETRLWSIHWRPEVGRIYPLRQSDLVRHAYFRPRSGKFYNVFRASTQHIKEEFLREWNDPTSDAREALRFCDLDSDERARQVLRWERGSIELLEHLVRAACACEPLLWEKSSSGYISIDPTENYPLYVYPTFNYQGQVQAMLSPRLHRVLQRICDHNPAYAQGGKNSRYFCDPWVPNLLDSAFEPDDIHIHIQLPTHHELIEASLFLRDWLRENAPDLLPDWFPDEV